MNRPPSRELTRQERARVRRLVTDLCANHDNQDRLCLPLDCPCYMPVDPALESAIIGEDTSLKQKTCPVCGKAYLPTTSQAYCSDSCRAFARRKSERERKRRIRQNRG